MSTKEQFNVRLPPELLERLDAWLARLNKGRRVPLKRSEMVRGILDWAADEQPDWETREPKPAKKAARR